MHLRLMNHVPGSTSSSRLRVLPCRVHVQQSSAGLGLSGGQRQSVRIWRQSLSEYDDFTLGLLL
jgi:ABC-type bacteriocin/lantibiotic exporter with double-glycine peptidase domain